jgi:hypothetical protein
MGSLEIKKYIMATCRILNGITWRERGFLLVLDGKIDGGTICIFSHSTGTTYDKK